MAEAVDTANAENKDLGTEVAEENRIFSGASFYLSHNVPSRSYFCDIITANGGKIVQVDSQADFIIVDDRKPALYRTTVYSYKFIEACVRNKRLEDIGQYCVGPKTEKKASAPAAKKHKAGRMPFTEEDDQILLNWLARPGISLSGFKVYKELSEKYPHHSFHGWRGRWVDKLSQTMPNGPEPKRIINFEGEGSGESEQEPMFTREDDEILLEFKDEIIGAENEKAVYKRIQKKHPHHSDIQWRHRFTNVVLPMLNKHEVTAPPVAEGEAEDSSPRPSEQGAVDVADPEMPEVAAQPAASREQEQEQEQEPAQGQEHAQCPRTPHPVDTQAHKRRASDDAGYAKMGNTASAAQGALKPRRARESKSLPAGLKQGRPLPFGDPGRPASSGQAEEIRTPTHHEIPHYKPPRSPKGHPTRDLTISPRIRTPPDESPAQQHTRVQKWRAEILKHTNEDEAVDSQLLAESRNSDQSSPRQISSDPSLPASPSLVPTRGAKHKRKRVAEPETEVNITATSHLPQKRPKTSRGLLQLEVQSTPEPEPHSAATNTQFPSTPPRHAGLIRKVKGASPTHSDLASLVPAPPTSSRISSAIKPHKPSYHDLSTQAIYDNIPDIDDEPLLNEEISGLDSDVEEEVDNESDEFAFTKSMKQKDEDVFRSTIKPRDQSRTVNAEKAKGALNFEATVDLNTDEFKEIEEGDSDIADEETIKKEEASLGIYLEEKSREYGLQERDVIEAIERTSGEKRLVDIVLQHMKKGLGIPTHIPGVYSEEDDEILRGKDGRKIMAVEKKHGNIVDRIEWLRKYDAA
ncbi:TRF2-interacting telomeric protein/Rap1 C terminal domain-containing protein [Kalaharituber pfeilii]|nr:TRF2-interacting telomeric protein/Rap1 C terminal domain-containing protein [Kalaharituber pfeilii]